jgi:DNA/RNA-binding domain of Phe-tRNA-synthetase-like protein
VSDQPALQTPPSAHPPLEYSIDPLTEAVGVRVEFAVIRGVTVARKHPDLERWRRPIQHELRLVDAASDPILIAYRTLLAAVGNPGALASPEYLLRLIQQHGKLPQINTLVDSYNVVSAQTRAVVSAHDLGRLSGRLRMSLLAEPASFSPLGSEGTEILPPGEFTIRDDRHPLCRLNCKQSRLSSVGADTRDVLLYAQGNPALQGEQLRSALDAACAAIIRFCGGERAPVSRVSG